MCYPYVAESTENGAEKENMMHFCIFIVAWLNTDLKNG